MKIGPSKFQVLKYCELGIVYRLHPKEKEQNALGLFYHEYGLKLPVTLLMVTPPTACTCRPI